MNHHTLLPILKCCSWSPYSRAGQLWSWSTTVLQSLVLILLLYPYCMVQHSMDWYGSLLGGFHCVQYLVPGTFSVPPRLRFQVSCTVTKMWSVNPADNWLAGENWTLQHKTPDPLDLSQYSIQTLLFLTTQKLLLYGLLKKYRRSSCLSPRSGSSESLMRWCV